MTDSKTYFAEVAEQWDEIRTGYFTEAMRDDAITRAQLPPNAVVADVGTGTGFVISALARQVAHAYGFDESPEMLAAAEKNLAEYTNVTLRQAEGSRIPLEDNTLDGVFANMYLHHVPDPPAAIEELVRILKPGGVVCIIDLDEHDREEQRTLMADRWLGFKREDVSRWYTAAGLTAIDVDCAAGNCCTTDSQGEEYSLSVFVAIGHKQ